MAASASPPSHMADVIIGLLSRLRLSVKLHLTRMAYSRGCLNQHVVVVIIKSPFAAENAQVWWSRLPSFFPRRTGRRPDSSCMLWLQVGRSDPSVLSDQ